MLLFLQQNKLCMLSYSVKTVKTSKYRVTGTLTKYD